MKKELFDPFNTEQPVAEVFEVFTLGRQEITKNPVGKVYLDEKAGGVHIQLRRLPGSGRFFLKLPIGSPKIGG